MWDTVLDKVKETADNAIEVVNERLLSPMYFYFIIARIISNWKFIFILFFVDQTKFLTPKLDYILKQYPSDSLWTYWKLIIFPVLWAFVAVWIFTMVSEKFYERYLQFKFNKVAIKRKIEYKEESRKVKEQIKIRKEVFDEFNIMKYEDNWTFNDILDNEMELIEINWITYKPSEVLYNTDYAAYEEMYNNRLP